MRRTLLRLITAIQLTRLTIAFGAVSDIWFVILLTRASKDYVMVHVHYMNQWAALAAGAVVAVGLFAYGAALNDVLDVRHDSAFSPERPIPAGRIKLSQAVIVAIAALIVAVLGGALLGGGQRGTWTVCVTLATAAGILFYNATGKYIPAVGVLTVGLIHAAHMFIPNYELAFLLPVWLVMTHATAIAAVVHVLEQKRPTLRGRTIAAIVVGWLGCTVMIVAAGAGSGQSWWPADVSRWGLAYPLACVIAFVAVAIWKTSRVTGRAAAEKLKRYGAMWQSLYGAAWLLALGMRVEAGWIGLFAVTGFLAMTFIKEVTGLTGRPLTYRVQ